MNLSEDLEHVSVRMFLMTDNFVWWDFVRNGSNLYSCVGLTNESVSLVLPLLLPNLVHLLSPS